METMTPSTITAGQIGKLQDLLGAALRKSGLQSEPTQQVIETQGEPLVAEIVAVIRKRVEAVGDMIARRVSVNRNRIPQEVLDATGRKQYTDSGVVATMPKGDGDGDEVEVYFFKVGKYVSDVDLEKEFTSRGLKPADAYSLAAVNEADPSFADEHPNGTHWQDADGKWCYIAFDRWFGEHDVLVYRFDDEWNVYWWFAGLRK